MEPEGQSRSPGCGAGCIVRSEASLPTRSRNAFEPLRAGRYRSRCSTCVRRWGPQTGFLFLESQRFGAHESSYSFGGGRDAASGCRYCTRSRRFRLDSCSDSLHSCVPRTRRHRYGLRSDRCGWWGSSPGAGGGRPRPEPSVPRPPGHVCRSCRHFLGTKSHPPRHRIHGPGCYRAVYRCNLRVCSVSGDASRPQRRGPKSERGALAHQASVYTTA